MSDRPSTNAPAGGERLDRLLGAPLPLDTFLALARAIADAVSALHARGAVHAAIAPARVFVDGERLRATLAGAPGAPGPQDEPSPSRPPPLVATAALPYASPEQVGRVGRAVDGRSDLYSVGVVLYEMLTGRLPFDARDPLEWVHCHLARTPPHPSRLVPGVPAAVADVVLKLLAKAPEDRYQSARGLRHDLDLCLAAWLAERRILPFPLGERDLPDRLRLPPRLYGRERELAALREVLERVASTARPELVLVSGPSGAGKTALVHELRRPVAVLHGTFLSGKFDERRQAAPCAPVVEPCRELVAALLAGQDRQLGAWRRRLQDALGANGRLVADLVPQLELVIGPQPPVPELAVTQAEARFTRTFERFFAELTAGAGPVVLFLDDLQWADAGSLTLVQRLVTTAERRPLVVVAAQRADADADADADGVGARVRDAVDAARAAGVAVREVEVPPLAPHDLAVLVRDALRCSASAAEPLAELVHEKTGGNPFFALQFLAGLADEGLLSLDPEGPGWRWDVARIAARSFTENVIDLLLAKLGRLSEPARSALELAAALGRTFELATVAAASARPEEETRRAIGEAVAEGLVRAVAGGFELVHDRVREAAYARVPEGARAALHLRLGRTLLARGSAVEPPDRVFEIVGQLERALPAMDAPEERERLAALELVAARRARASAAFAAAAEHAAVGLSALGDDPWSADRALAFALSLEAAECELGSREVDRAARRLAPLAAGARTRAERIAARRVAVDVHTARGESIAALEVAIECLALAGVTLAVHPARAEVDAADDALSARLAAGALEGLLDLPLASDPDDAAVMGVLAGILPSAYFVDADLHRLVACTMVDLTLRRGLTPMSPMGLAAYGIERCIAGRWAEAGRLGDLALAMIERRGFAACRSKVCNVVGAAIAVWTRDLRSAIAILREGVRAGEESGDQIFACLNRVQIPVLLAAAGDPLDEIDAETERAVAFVRNAGYAPLADPASLLGRLVRALQGGTDGETSFAGPGFDEAAFARGLATHPLPLTAAWFHALKLQAQVVAGDVAGGAVSAEALRPVVALVHGQHLEADAAFFSALALAAAWGGADGAARAARGDELCALDARLRAWAEAAPPTFLARSALVAAERARIEDRFDEAMHLYGAAVRAARAHGLVQVEALAHERAARACEDRGFEESVEVYLREARACYARWGAHAKVRRLDARLARAAAHAPDAGPVLGAGLDALAVAKAAQAISGEIVLERVLERLLAVAVEQAGARRAALLLARPEGLLLGATAEVDAGTIAVEVRSPFVVPAADEVPGSVVQYVRRTREAVVVADAAAHETFSSDPCVARRGTRALLGLPILRRGELEGVLCLENDLVAGAFSRERLEALSLVATQAAISMENAMLVAQERTAVRLRDEFLAVASHELRTPMTSLGLSLQTLERSLRPGGAVDRAGAARALSRALFAGRRLDRLVLDLLDVSRLAVGRLPLVADEVDLGAVVREVAERLEPELARAGCPLAIRGEGPVLGRWDGSRLDQVVTNLLTNALKFGAGRPIDVQYGERDGRAWLTVRDEGIGIAPSEQARVFERFGRAVPTRHYGGLGLGLYIARSIVEAHGGTIAVVSAPGAGSTFTVELPGAATAPRGADRDARAATPGP